MNRPVTTFISMGEIRAPGMRTISALLKQRGWETNLVIYKVGYFEGDVPTQREEDILLGVLRDLKTDIVGMTVIAPFYAQARRLTERIKKELHAMVVWGGSHPTILPSKCIGYADVLCRGEGEYPFVELVEGLAKGETVDTIGNLWINKDGRIIRNEIRPFLHGEDLDKLPYPDCDGDNKYVVNRGGLVQGDPLNATIEYYPFASRGCPFRCSFCINSALSELYRDLGPRTRVKSPEYVVGEIQHMLKSIRSVRRIRFEDEIFPWQLDWVERFCREYKEKVGLPFLVASHPNVISEDTIKLLKDAGLMVVGFGVQSPCERVRKGVLQRTETNQTILNCIDILQRNQVECSFDAILDNSYETDEDKTDGLNFLLSIPKPFHITTFSMKYFPGHKLTDDALEKRVVTAQEVDSLCAQGWFRLTYDWKGERSPRDTFWNCLYMLSSRSIVPPRLLKFLGGSDFLKKHPSVLVLFAKWSWYGELLVIGMRRYRRKQLKPLYVLKVIILRMLKRTI